MPSLKSAIPVKHIELLLVLDLASAQRRGGRLGVLRPLAGAVLSMSRKIYRDHKGLHVRHVAIENDISAIGILYEDGVQLQLQIAGKLAGHFLMTFHRVSCHRSVCSP